MVIPIADQVSNIAIDKKLATAFVSNGNTISSPRK